MASQTGVNGRCWRLIRNRYSGLSAQVRSGNAISDSFLLNCGIFTIPISFPAHHESPAYTEMEELGLQLHRLHLRAFAHADDVRSLTIDYSVLSSRQNVYKVLQICMA